MYLVSESIESDPSKEKDKGSYKTTTHIMVHHSYNILARVHRQHNVLKAYVSSQLSEDYMFITED